MNIFIFLQFRISTGFLLLFTAFFLPLRYEKKKTLAVLLAGYFVTGLMDYYCFISYENVRVPLVVTFAEILIIQSIPLIISEYRDFRSIFIGITSSAYVLGGNVLSSTLYIAGFGIFVCVVSAALTHGILLWIFVSRLREGIMQILRSEGVNWVSLCLIPSLFYAALYTITTWPGNIYEQPANLIGSYCILALQVTAYITIIQLIIRIRRDGELRRNMEYLETYADRLKYETDVLQEKEQETAMLRHDLRHYTILFESCLEAGDLESLRTLTKKLDSNMERLKPVRYCENLSINAVIDHCVREARKQGVDFSVAVDLPRKFTMDEFEFATVLSNLLENALHAAQEAAEGRREMWINAYVIKDKLIIEIGNTFGEKPELSGTTGFPVSKKGKQHGYGLKSVGAFVQKTGALLDYTITEEKIFVRLLVNSF